MTDADKVMNTWHFGSDGPDIQVNPEIRIGILDHFWLRLDALAEVCSLSPQSSYFCNHRNKFGVQSGFGSSMPKTANEDKKTAWKSDNVYTVLFHRYDTVDLSAKFSFSFFWLHKNWLKFLLNFGSRIYGIFSSFSTTASWWFIYASIFVYQI